MTRLDTTFAIGVARSYMQKPKIITWKQCDELSGTSKEYLTRAYCTREKENVRWLAFEMLTMREIMILEGQWLDMYSISAKQLSHGAAKNNQQYHCLLQGLSTGQQQR